MLKFGADGGSGTGTDEWSLVDLASFSGISTVDLTNVSKLTVSGGQYGVVDQVTNGQNAEVVVQGASGTISTWDGEVDTLTFDGSANPAVSVGQNATLQTLQAFGSSLSGFDIELNEKSLEGINTDELDSLDVKAINHSGSGSPTVIEDASGIELADNATVTIDGNDVLWLGYGYNGNSKPETAPTPLTLTDGSTVNASSLTAGNNSYTNLVLGAEAAPGATELTINGSDYWNFVTVNLSNADPSVTYDYTGGAEDDNVALASAGDFDQEIRSTLNIDLVGDVNSYLYLQDVYAQGNISGSDIKLMIENEVDLTETTISGTLGMINFGDDDYFPPFAAEEGDPKLYLTATQLIDLNNASSLSFDDYKYHTGDYNGGLYLVVEQNTDISGVDTELSNIKDSVSALQHVDFEAAGKSLTVTAFQADGVTASGAGSNTLNVIDMENTPWVDLGDVNVNSLNVELDSSGDVAIGPSADLNDAAVTITGNGTVDIDPGATLDQASFEVGANATLELTKAQADGRSATGEGDVIAQDVTSTTDLSFIDTDTGTLTANVADTETSTVDLSGIGNTVAEINAATNTNNVALTAGDGDQTIRGGSGDNIIIGGSGADTMNGGAGDDVFRYDLTSADHSDSGETIDGGTEDSADVIQTSGTGAALDLTDNTITDVESLDFNSEASSVKLTSTQVGSFSSFINAQSGTLDLSNSGGNVIDKAPSGLGSIDLGASSGGQTLDIDSTLFSETTINSHENDDLKITIDDTTGDISKKGDSLNIFIFNNSSTTAQIDLKDYTAWTSYDFSFTSINSHFVEANVYNGLDDGAAAAAAGDDDVILFARGTLGTAGQGFADTKEEIVALENDATSWTGFTNGAEGMLLTAEDADHSSEINMWYYNDTDSDGLDTDDISLLGVLDDSEEGGFGDPGHHIQESAFI